MAYKTQLSGYVKFLRGTPAAWESIETKDADTLYFIAEPNATKGTLYLGNKLISGGGGSGSAVTIGDLEDVLIGVNIPSDAVLIYDDVDQVWKPVALDTAVAQVIGIMTGATAEKDGLAGLVPVPVAGDNTLFLRGDGTWADPTTQLAQEIQFRFDDLYAGDSGSIRSIATDVLNGLVDGAPAEFDTLKELADWVANHEEVIDIAQAAEDIDNLTTAMFGTVENPAETNAELAQMVQTQGVIRILTSLQNSVFGTESTNGLDSRVSALEFLTSDHTADINDLNTALTAANDRMDTIESDIDAIDERLRWVDVVEE